ncbi:MAG: LytTR family transcriptional regulator DNA-binding domain-containing protein [Salaquimonas sp.]
MKPFKNRKMTPNQPNYADDAEYFAKEPPLQITLRVMHTMYSNPRFWIGFVAIIAMLTIMGPFDTLNDLSFAPRLVYWASISLVTFPLGMACSVFFGSYFFQRGIPEWLSRVFGGFIGGLPIGLFVWLVNKYIAENDIGTWHDLGRLTFYTVVISTAVSILYYLVESSLRGEQIPPGQTAHSQESFHPASTATVAPAPQSPFFQRLNVELGKDLISLQAQDHYIKVTTAKGSEMILLRLSDAESELDLVEGLKTHRSWWVARKHAKSLVRENNKLMLELSTGQKVPVSRSYAGEVREALK